MHSRIYAKSLHDALDHIGVMASEGHRSTVMTVPSDQCTYVIGKLRDDFLMSVSDYDPGPGEYEDTRHVCVHWTIPADPKSTEG